MNRTISGYSACALLLSATILLLAPSAGWGHGVVGKRFFPAMVTVEDPFVADEMGVMVDHIKGQEAMMTELELEIQKRLGPNLSIGFSGSYRIMEPSGDPRGMSGEGEEMGSPGTAYGFSNPAFSLNYQFLRDPERELAGTLSFGIEAGGVGAKRVGALSGTTITPSLQLGKGFGDLPDWADYLKPLAVTGSLGVNNLVSGRGETEDAQNNLAWGVTIMYSIPYLQSFVMDVGIPWPFSLLFPVVEFNGETILSGDRRGETTAFANPGLIWAGKYLELAVEAKIPLNDLSGRQVGIVGLVHLFLDNIAPEIFTWTPFHGVLGPTYMGPPHH